MSSHVRHTLDLQATPKNKASTQIRAVAIDAQDSRLHAATSSLSLTSSSQVNLDLWQITPVQRHLSSFSAPLSRPLTNRGGDQQVVALDHLSDGGSFVDNEPALCLVCAGGDIALLALSDDSSDDDPVLPEIVGSVEQGILAARWSPDEELLLLVTAPTPAELADDGRPKGSTLLIMTRDFEVLSEEVLQTDDFGEERPITLGWGSKATQFHGSEGKGAAAAAAETLQASQTPTEHSPRGPLIADDDLLPRISWRGDSNIFAVSSVEAYGPSSQHRLIRTFGKTGSLLATSDPSARGVSHVLAFKPTGILMATTRRSDTGHELAFFERNGLPKGGFPLRDVALRVKEVAWNCDGSLLAIWLDTKVQLWSTGNYHWYLKQEIAVEEPVACMRWHSEQPLAFYLGTSRSIYSRSFTLDNCVSSSKSPHDAACAAVVDGARLLLTPFRIQNIPPPMSSIELELVEGKVPVDMSWADVSSDSASGISASILVVLSHPGRVACYLFDWGTLGSKPPRGGRPLPTPKLLCQFDFGLAARQVAVAASRSTNSVRLTVGVLASEGFESLKIATGKANLVEMSLSRVTFGSLALGKAAKRVLVALSSQSRASPSGDLSRRIYVHDDRQLRNLAEEKLALPAFFPSLTVLQGDQPQVVGLTENGWLYINNQLLAKDATSFALTDHNIVWTSAAHEARFLPIASVLGIDSTVLPSEPVSLGRRIERGSRIVTAVPSSMSLVLQMPRGNLETIAPRPLVLEVITRALEEKRYGHAYRICRTHRLDMNLLVDYNRAAFLAGVELFVKQVRDGEYLNLFLSSLREEDVTKTIYKPLGVAPVVENGAGEESKVNAICDSVRRVLEAMDEPQQYINTILTTYVRKMPPDYESGLRLLQRLKEEDAGLADEACKYIIFLTDADKLFHAALGMYDFTLPLLVAHHSPRKDPREYLPFLRELRDVQPLEMQRFRIDETLGRWGKALGWIVKAGEEHFDQAAKFIVAHDLYPEAMLEFSGNPKLGVIQEMFGDWLQEKHRFKEAGLLFARCAQHQKAIEANVKAGAWKDAFEIAATQKISRPNMVALARRVASSLASYGRNAEAATVAIDYLEDVEEGVTYLCKDMEFGEAKRIAAMHNRSDLVETHILPSLMESSEMLLEEIGEMSEQANKQFVRLAELRKKKKESPEDYYPDVETGELEGEDGLSQAFTTFTRFTRYSAFTRGHGAAAGSTMSAFTMKTNRTAKSRKKDLKKQQTGKKGSIYEEDYLFESLQKLLDSKLGKMQNDVANVLVHFGRTATGGEKYRRRAREVHLALATFEASMSEQAELVWKETVREEEEMESQRLKAIEEAIQLGVSWSQLQANGLFAPQLQRKQIQVSKADWQLDALQYL